VTYFH